MKFGIFGDWHWRGKDFADHCRVGNEMADGFLREGVECVLNVGDTFHKGKIVDAYISSGKIVSYLHAWMDRLGLPMLMLEGNHDQYGEDDSAFDVFRHPNVVQVRDEVKHFRIGESWFVCIPWLRESRIGCEPKAYVKAAVEKCYRAIQGNTRDVKSINILGHCDAVGAALQGPLSISSTEYSGFCFDFGDMCKGMSGLDNIWLGHIHARQAIKVPSQVKCGMYIGYPMCLGHGEEANPTGWLLYDDVERTTQFVGLNSPRYYTFPVSLEHDYAQLIQPHDRIRMIGTPSIIFNTPHQEILSDSLEVNAIKHYIDSKDLSFPQIFKKWCDITEIELPSDMSVISEYVNQLNMTWESLQGKLTKLKHVKLDKVHVHEHKLVEFRSGVTVITGLNGSGKSLILESFPTTVFGQWVSNRGSATNSLSHKGSSLEVAFSVDEKAYRAVRTSKDLKIYDGNNNLCNGPLKRDSEAFLISLLGDKDSFLQSCFIDQDCKHDLITCPPFERMKILRTFLKLDTLEPHYEIISKRLEILDKTLTQLLNQVEQEDNLLHELNDLESITLNLQDHLTSIAEHQLCISIDLEEAREHYYSQKQRQDLQTEIETRSKKLDQDLSKFNKLYELLKANKPLNEEDFIKKETKANQLTDQIHEFNQLMRELDYLKPSCDLLSKAGCGPNYLPCPLIDKSREDCTKLQEIKAKLDNIYVKDLILLRDTLEQDIKLYNQSKNAYNKTETEYKILKRELELNQQELDRLNANYNSLNLESSKDFNSLQREYNEINNQILNFEIELSCKSIEIRSINKQLEEIAAAKKILSERDNEYRSLQILEKAFSKSGISHYLASSAIPEFQEIFDSFMSKMFNNKYRVTFDNIAEKKTGKLKEEFSIMFSGQNETYDVRCCSPGQKSVIRLLWKLVLIFYQRRRSQGYQVLFMDELTSATDIANSEAIYKLIEYLKEHFHQLILVTHSEDLVPIADNLIRL